MAETLLQIGTRPQVPQQLPPQERVRLEQRAKLLAWGGNAWHLIEFAIAVGAGIAASSVALIGFGADSLIEGLAGFVVVWLFTGGRGASEHAERPRSATDRGELLRPRRLHRGRVAP